MGIVATFTVIIMLWQHIKDAGNISYTASAAVI